MSTLSLGDLVITVCSCSVEKSIATTCLAPFSNARLVFIPNPDPTSYTIFPGTANKNLFIIGLNYLLALDAS